MKDLIIKEIEKDLKAKLQDREDSVKLKELELKKQLINFEKKQKI